MDDYNQLRKKQNQMFFLVLINFILFMVLFAGVGYVAWQSFVLVSRLQNDLARTEQTVVNLQDKLRKMDTNLLVERIVEKTTGRLAQSIETVLENTDLVSPITKVSDKLDTTQEKIIETGEAIKEIRSAVKGLDNEDIARRVSYNILKGLGDGFQEAAESRSPAPLLKQ